MSKFTYSLFFIALGLVLFPKVHVFSQDLNGADTVRINSTQLVLPDSTGTVTTTTDSTDVIDIKSIAQRKKEVKEKEKKERPNTLTNNFFVDSLKDRKILSWQHNQYLNSWKLVPLDTNINADRNDFPFFQRNDVGTSFLGQIGGASIRHDYFLRKSNNEFTFINPYLDYFVRPNEVKFYNSKVPYTELAFSTSGKKQIAEDNVHAIFAINLRPEFNVGISYYKYGTRGLYQNQSTRDKALTLFTSYSGERYSAHAGYIYNNVKNNENGGIFDDFYITDTVIDPEVVPVQLLNASNRVRNNTFFLTHTYGIPFSKLRSTTDSTNYLNGTTVYFGHSFEYSTYYRVYEDQAESSDTTYHKYYKNFYLSPNSSRDSSYSNNLENKLFIRLQPWQDQAILSKIDGGVGHQMQRYYYFKPEFYLEGASKKKYNNNMYLYGAASGNFKSYFAWDAFLKYTFMGYFQNDLYFNANATLSAYPKRLPQGVHLTGSFTFDSKEAPYFTKHYFSNHFKWENNFDKTTETRIVASFSVPDWDLKAEFRNSLLVKPIFWNNDAMPEQSSKTVNITSAYLHKTFKLWLFRFENNALLQIPSDKEVTPLPLVSLNARYYLQAVIVKNALTTQVGVDVYYNTKFYDYAYNPATGMFHTQNEKKLGEYPYADAFAHFRWKRANFYIRVTNVGQGLFDDNYFSALHYPRNKRMLKMGLTWRFYN